MADFKELKEEELEKVNGGGAELVEGTIRYNSDGVKFEILEASGNEYGLKWFKARILSVPDAVKNWYTEGGTCDLHSGLVV